MDVLLVVLVLVAALVVAATQMACAVLEEIRRAGARRRELARIRTESAAAEYAVHRIAEETQAAILRLLVQGRNQRPGGS